jgi:hypothetical protein
MGLYKQHQNHIVFVRDRMIDSTFIYRFKKLFFFFLRPLKEFPFSTNNIIYHSSKNKDYYY